MGKVATSPLPSRGSPPLQSGGQNHKWPTSGQNGYVTPAVSGIPTAADRGQNEHWPTCGQNGYINPAVSGIPTASERGAKSEVAHSAVWGKWLRHPCRLGDPHRCRAGGKIRRGPLVGKMATSPLPSRGSPPLQSGGQNQKWPTCGQNGYVTRAVSGIPTASERGAKSEVAHKWAKWLRHPCRLGDPHRFRAGGKIRSGPLVGKMATSPLPSRGSPPLQSGGQNQKWPTCGQNGYATPAVSGIPTASERGAKSDVAHKCGQSGYVTPAVSGIPTASERGAKSEVAHSRGKMATSPLPSRGSPPLQSGGQIQKWPTSGQSGYVTPAVSGIPTASERGAKSEVAHKWAKWLRHPCRLGDPHRFRARGKIRSGPLVGKMATSPLPSRGSPPLQSRGQIQKWPTCRQSGYVTLASRGSPPLQSGGQNQKWPTCEQNGYVTPAVSGIPTASERGANSEVAHVWAKWLRHPCRLGDPHRFRAGGKIRRGPQVGKVATSPLPSRGSPPLHSAGQHQKWPTCGQTGYVTPAVSGIPSAAERGAKSEVAHLWAKWLRHPCRLGDPRRFRAGGKFRSGPEVGKVATPPLPSRGSPPLQSGGQNQKWPTCGQNGYVTPAVSGIPHRFRARGKIRSGSLVGKMATPPLPSRGSPPLQSRGAKSDVAHNVGKVAMSPLPSRGSPPLQSAGQNQKWPTCGQNGYVTPAVFGIPTASERGAKSEVAHKCGQSGYVTPAVSGIPTASERGAKSEVAHLWSKWLRHPCRLGDPHRRRAGALIQKWPTCRQSGYVTLAVSGIPNASERGAKSEVAHLWAKWLRHPCRLGDPHRSTAGGKFRSGPRVGKMATSPLPSRGSPPLQSGGQNQKWPTCGQSGYVTPAVSGIPTASERGAKSEVAHLWSKWLCHPCRLGDPHRCRAGGQIQKWPTCRQSGYVTLAVSGIPTASERGAKSEVAHLWAKWLRHPCRLGDPHRSTAGGKFRSGPRVGKMATSPLPSRGSPPL